MTDTERQDLGLFTDLYQLTMLDAYLQEGMHDDAVFTLFVRRLPEERKFLLAAGLDPLLETIENLSFSDEDL
ncbi:MAG TPA: nicotinate phosphoribosyltransferase, partial [Idiomarina abyssalis]|nr:nicotinate phosphoribosyltransferase [Idiomarina abyssalis]